MLLSRLLIFPRGFGNEGGRSVINVVDVIDLFVVFFMIVAATVLVDEKAGDSDPCKWEQYVGFSMELDADDGIDMRGTLSSTDIVAE